MSKPGHADNRCATCSHHKFEHGGRRRNGGSSSPRCIVKGCVCPGFVSHETVARANRRRARPAPQGFQCILFTLDDDA